MVNGQSQGTHNVLYVATEHDSLYAFDADTGVLYWQTSLLPTGESPVQANCSDLVPEIGITATPVIDKSAGANGTIFVVAFSTDGSGGYFNRLHAIDLATGNDQTGIGPVLINPGTVSGTSPFNTFNSTNQRGRAGLLLLNGIIYTSWEVIATALRLAVGSLLITRIVCRRQRFLTQIRTVRPLAAFFRTVQEAVFGRTGQLQRSIPIIISTS